LSYGRIAFVAHRYQGTLRQAAEPTRKPNALARAAGKREKGLKSSQASGKTRLWRW